MKLYLDIATCVRATSKFSQCTKCVEAAPESIQIIDNLPSFPNATGVEAAASIGACPMESFFLGGFSVTEFFFSFLESKASIVIPEHGIPCLSMLSVEHLVSLAVASKDNVILDMSKYEEDTHLYKLINKRIEEANFILSSFSSKQLVARYDLQFKESENSKDTAKERRSFLQSVSIKGAVKHKISYDEAMEADELKRFELDEAVISKIRQKSIPDKRKILFATLKRADPPNIFEVLPEEEIGFVSQKFIDSSCTNCQICYRICPTGSLSSNGNFSIIYFDAMLCVKCRLCHDVCEADAIHLQPGFETKEFFEPTQRVLATFDIKRCNECGNHFTYTGGEQTCPRCMIEEEEAIFLHKNALKIREEDLE